MKRKVIGIFDFGIRLETVSEYQYYFKKKNNWQLCLLNKNNNDHHKYYSLPLQDEKNEVLFMFPQKVNCRPKVKLIYFIKLDLI